LKQFSLSIKVSLLFFIFFKFTNRTQETRGNAASLCGWENCKLKKEGKEVEEALGLEKILVVGGPCSPHWTHNLAAESPIVPKAVKPPQTLVDHGRRRDNKTLLLAIMPTIATWCP